MNNSADAPSLIGSVDVIVPLRNEEAFVPALVAQITGQTFPVSRIFLVVAPSEDATMALCVREAELDSRITVLDNPGATAPHAMNRAIPLVQSDAWVRIDGHQEIPSTLIETLCDVMNKTGAACVGPVTETVATQDNPTQAAIALAMASRWGVGNARFRTGTGGSGEVDAVAYGMYRRRMTDVVGLFNVAMTRNQDDEYNTRLRRAGGRIWLTDRVAVRYYPRPTLRRLADQYRQYGHWRLVGTVVFGNELRIRQLAPPALVAAACGSLLLSLRGRPAVLPFFGATYGAILLAQAHDAHGKGAGLSTAMRSSAAVATMHWAYGLGFWQGAVTAARKAKDLRRLAEDGRQVE